MYVCYICLYVFFCIWTSTNGSFFLPSPLPLLTFFFKHLHPSSILLYFYSTLPTLSVWTSQVDYSENNPWMTFRKNHGLIAKERENFVGSNKNLNSFVIIPSCLHVINIYIFGLSRY